MISKININIQHFFIHTRNYENTKKKGIKNIPLEPCTLNHWN
jgi:hypothetical protein